MSGLTSLFRPEAVQASGVRLDGEAFVFTPPWLWLPIGLGAALALVAAVFAAQTSFTSWARAPGALAPDRGLASVPAPRGGRVLTVLVREGDRVAAGAPLVELAPTYGLAEDAGAIERRRALIDAQSTLTDDQLRDVDRWLSAERDSLAERRARLLEQRRLAEVALGAQQRRAALAREEVNRLSRIEQSGFLARTEFARREAAMLQEEQAVAEQVSRLTDLEIQLRELDRQVERAAFDARERRASLLREASATVERRVSVEAMQAHRVTAPIAGTVTSVRVAPGQATEPGATLVVIIPDGSRMEAVILVPTRDAGMLRPGQPALIEYAGFPFEQFGRAKATVARVDRAVLLKGERAGALVAEEPSFRTFLRLEAEEVQAHGRSWPLTPGMLLDARIAVRSRSLLGWLLEPLEAARPVFIETK